MNTETIIRIRRSSPSEARLPEYVDYRVPVRSRMTVLDAIAHVQQHDDSTLAFRYSCRVGMCGTCAVVINGREGWACRTMLADLGTTRITLEPLRNMPVVKDLVVDMQPFVSAFTRVLGSFVAGEQPTVAPSAAERQDIDAHIECITCGACYSACTMIEWDRDYLGPAALNRAATLLMDSRDAAHGVRLATIDGEHGCWRCHSQFTCTEVCPMHLRPTESIGYLKRRLVVGAVRRGLGLDGGPSEESGPADRPDPTGGASFKTTRRSWLEVVIGPIAAAATLAFAIGLAYLANVEARSTVETSAFVLRKGSRQPAQLAGAALFEEKGCQTCHAILGSGGRTAPDLWHVGGKRDETWLRGVLEDPDSVIGPGLMPAYPLREREITALVAYLGTLDFTHDEVERVPRAVVRDGADRYRQELTLPQ